MRWFCTEITALEETGELLSVTKRDYGTMQTFYEAGPALCACLRRSTHRMTERFSRSNKPSVTELPRGGCSSQL